MTMSSGAKLPSLRSTPILFLGRSLMWPTEASTVKSFPRYLLIVFALAGDSTITSYLLIVIRIWAATSTSVVQDVLSPALSATSASATYGAERRELYIRLT